MSRRFLIFLLVIFSFLTGHAGTFGFTTKLQGGLQIVPNATLETQDDQYSSMSATGAPGAIWHANNFNRDKRNIAGERTESIFDKRKP